VSDSVVAPIAGADSDFDRRLAALAELCVARGVNLQRGQELIVSAPLDAAALVRQVARRAYARGSKSVTCVYEDPLLIRDHIVEADIDALAYAPEWMYRGMAEGLGAGAARLQIVGPYPDLLSGVATDRIIRAHGALAHASRAVAPLIAAAAINWSVVPIVTRSWARHVFPDAPEEAAQRQLWGIVFDVTRASDAEPLQAFDAHLRALDARREGLQRRDFRSLRFFDGTTDLRVDLADGHRWLGGTVVAANGVAGVQSIPTEEVFTALRGDAAHGHVLFSRPLALGGAVVENLYAVFDHGALMTTTADRGLEAFQQLIAADGGAGKLGEVGLVPASSRVARTGISFRNPLFDRNAASHVAFGQSPVAGVDRRVSSTDLGGANDSAMHIDCALGHAAMHVDGVTRSGDVVPVMRDGAFVD
jgi:aminopeptidase